MFHAALDLPPEKRPDYLRTNCADDGIWAEVESLLDAAGDSAAPIDEPALKHARQAIDVALASDSGLSLLIGRTLGQYEIISLLGAGAAWARYTVRATGG